MQQKHFVNLLVVTAVVVVAGFVLYTVCYNWTEQQEKAKQISQAPKPPNEITGFGTAPA